MLCANPTTDMATRILAIFLTTITLASCSGKTDTASSTNTTPPPLGTTVQVSVTATDPDGDQLHYRWAATDGTINNVDAPKTTWVVPPSSGLQFAYVVVSDSKGGYIESRAAALTFDPPTVTSPPAHSVPPAVPTGNPGFVWGSVYSASFNRNVYLPGVKVKLSNGAEAVTDMKGQFFIPSVPDGSSYTATYQIPDRPAATFKQVNSNTDLSIIVEATTPNPNFPTSPSAVRYVQGQVALSGALQVAGSVRLADHTFCGIRDEFFTRSSAPNLFREPVSGTAQLIDSGGNPLSVAFPINHYGDFLIVRGPVDPTTEAKVRITCEGEVVDSTTLTLDKNVVKLPSTIRLPNNRPIVGKMTVLLNGQDIGRPDLPKPRTLFTSANGTPATFGDAELIAEIIHTPGDDTFFTYKGIDTRKSACAYYKAIGAVEGCDVDGFPTGAQLTLAQWRSKFNLSPFSNGTPSTPIASDGQEVRLQYINRSDLNLGRDMQAVKLSNGDIAYNTCNYPGPQNVNDRLGAPAEIGPQTEPDNQANIDLAIDNARRGIGMIACVAMDYSAIPGINGDRPFTKFYTFGPRGQLLLSISLDGRREKFMPGTCTTCHGGDAYGGQFPEDGSGRPDLQSRWQPFDMANLKMSFRSTEDLETAKETIKTLNQRMNFEAVTTLRTRQLINGWYQGGGVDQNSNFIPEVIKTKYNPSNELYQKVIQPGCQTCHAAQKVDENVPDIVRVCGGSKVLEQNHKMTNSLVPFERFWLDSAIPPLLSCGTTPAKHPAL